MVLLIRTSMLEDGGARVITRRTNGGSFRRAVRMDRRNAPLRPSDPRTVRPSGGAPYVVGWLIRRRQFRALDDPAM